MSAVEFALFEIYVGVILTCSLKDG